MEYGLIANALMSIDKGDYSVLSKKRYTEEELRRIALGIKRRDEKIITNELIMSYIEEHSDSDYDWNMGSILSHIDFGIVLSVINNIDVNKKPFLYDSLGISWLLGEVNSQNKTVIDFLEKVIEHSRNSTAWWNAAYSLKEIDNRNAVSLLKKRILRNGLKDLDYYLKNISDKKSIIGILIHANTKTVKEEIYPELLELLPNSSRREKINIIWLLGRLRLFNTKAYSLVKDVIDNSDDYELIYQIFKAMEENPSKDFYHTFRSNLDSSKELLVKLSIRGIAKIGDTRDIEILKDMLLKTDNESLIGEISKTIYILEDPSTKRKEELKNKYSFYENGLIYDKTNSWYDNPDLYENFSQFEDNNRIAFSIIERYLKGINHEIINPVDLGTGTGRTLKLIYENIDYKGTLYGIDNSKKMIDYLTQHLDGTKSFVKKVQLIETNIEDFDIEPKSSLIISSFGFPSKSSDIDYSYKELKNVYNNLTEDGLLITYGWDEYFNDELIEMWYKYIPDSVISNSFEHWSSKKIREFKSPRNCNLKWFKRQIKSQLRFDSLEDSVKVMSSLFGRDCIDEIIEKKKTAWWLSLGITINTKTEIKKALEEYKNERN